MGKLVKPELENNEVFIPTDRKGNGRIIQLHELKKGRKTLVNINQYQAVREAERAGGYVLSLAEDWQVYNYARAHQKDPKLKQFYERFFYPKFARHTRTQVHGLQTAHPYLVNIKRVHPKHDIVLEYEDKIIEVPWLPKVYGYIQKLDEETGLPRGVGDEPNPESNNTYFCRKYSFDVAAVIRNWGSGSLFLDLSSGPSSSSEYVGVRLAKNYSVKDLEKRVR